MPPLRIDVALSDEGVVQLGMVTPLATLASAVTPGRAELEAFGSDVSVLHSSTQDVCGEIAFTAQPDFRSDEQGITLNAAKLSESERQRLVDEDVDPPERGRVRLLDSETDEQRLR